MAKNRHNPYPDSGATVTDAAVAVQEMPEPALPEQDGTQPIPQPAPARRRRERNPAAPRPFYLLCAVAAHSDAIRPLMREETIGRARKMGRKLANLIQASEVGPVILRCKVVA